MIDISERAQKHFLRLLSQQGIEGLSIRLRVTSPGTAAANCELEFAEPDELTGQEWTIVCDGFDFNVDGDSAPWLEGASIDFEPNATGGQLNIRAPRIKGEIPGAEAGLIERVRYVLEAEVNPKIASHGGRVSLLEVDADGVVVIPQAMAEKTIDLALEKAAKEDVVRDEIAGGASLKTVFARHGIL